MSAAAPSISGVVVHWRAAEELRALAAAWPKDSDYELVVVDNSAAEEPAPEIHGARILRPAGNLGFAAGINLGAREARAPWLLLLNPDARPEPEALAELRRSSEREPRAAGFAPRLVGLDGTPQHRWQLRPLPRLDQLLRQAFFLPGPAGPRREPAPGSAVGQPAAAALLVSRETWERLGGFDEGFYPAWFEDVDFARRVAAAGGRFLYCPAAVFRHRLGGSLGALGYGGFLVAYARNLARYVEKHHGEGAARALRLMIRLGAVARLVALPLRRPRRAASAREAAAALRRLAAAPLTAAGPAEAAEP